MAIPDFQSVMLPFLETLQDGKERITNYCLCTEAVQEFIYARP